MFYTRESSLNVKLSKDFMKSNYFLFSWFEIIIRVVFRIQSNNIEFWENS